MDKLVMEINDCNSILESKVEINKINVVGGVNGSGKSTVSRIFYSFLKANSVYRKDFILDRVINRTNKLIDDLNLENEEYELPEHLTINDDISSIINTLKIILEISNDYYEISISKKQKFLKKFNIFKEKLINVGVDIVGIEFNLNLIDSDYFITNNFADYIFRESDLNWKYMDDYSELRTIWESYQHYANFHYTCLSIYSEVENFFIEDNPSVNEKIFNEILLKEHVPINNKDFDLKMIMDEINKIIGILNFEGNEFDLPSYLTVENYFSDLINTLNVLLEISNEYDQIVNIKKKKLKNELINKFESIIEILISKNIDVSDIESALYSINDDMYVDSEYFVDSIFNEYNLFLDYTDDYMELDNLIDSYNYFNMNSDVNDRCVAIDSVINEFFDKDSILEKNPKIYELLLNGEYIKDVDSNISFRMLSSGCDPFTYFYDNIVNSVYYIDNVSIFDINHEEMLLTNHIYHMDELIRDIWEDGYIYELNEDFKDIMEKIDKIIEGRYQQQFHYFVSNRKNDPLSFLRSHKKNLETNNTDTPSGVKQIGMIQLLLLRDKLKTGGYLIIDEPEVNLHPEWQFKFAEILVLIAKDLNITIYLNSHSPTFIESIDAFTQYYDMEDDINYYLTERSEIEGKFNFNKINSDELYKIYSNLGNVYDEINKLRIRKRLKDRG